MPCSPLSFIQCQFLSIFICSAVGFPYHPVKWRRSWSSYYLLSYHPSFPRFAEVSHSSVRALPNSSVYCFFFINILFLTWELPFANYSAFATLNKPCSILYLIYTPLNNNLIHWCDTHNVFFINGMRGDEEAAEGLRVLSASAIQLSAIDALVVCVGELSSVQWGGRENVCTWYKLEDCDEILTERRQIIVISREQFYWRFMFSVS